MPFIARVRKLSSIPVDDGHVNEIPLIVYFHQTGYDNAFGRGAKGFSEGCRYVDGIIDEYSREDMFLDADFILGALWGSDGQKVAEFHGYGQLNGDWNSNPTAFSPWVFRDGIYRHDADEVGCGEMTIAFGREEHHRRFNTQDEKDFVSRAPILSKALWLNGRPARY